MVCAEKSPVDGKNARFSTRWPVADVSDPRILRAMMTEILSYIPHSSGPLGISLSYWVIFGVSMLASLAVGGMLKRRFAEYSEVPMPLPGAAAAELMLRQNGITDVQVVSVPGQLTDHYDPTTKTVNLSEPVYHAASVAAVAVAASSLAVDSAPAPAPPKPTPAPGKCCRDCGGRGYIVQPDGNRTRCPCPDSCACRKACAGDCKFLR
jgi:hypothetical protein